MGAIIQSSRFATGGGGGGSSSIVLVQSNKGNSFGGATATPTLPGAATAGNLIVAGTRSYFRSGTIAGMTKRTGFNSGLFDAVAAGGETSFTLTNSGGSDEVAWVIAEFSGLTSSPYDTSAEASAAAASINTGSITPVQARTMLISLATQDTNTSMSWDSSFVSQVLYGPGGSEFDLTVGLAMRAVTSIASYSTTATAGAGGGIYASIAAYKRT